MACDAWGIGDPGRRFPNGDELIGRQNRGGARRRGVAREEVARKGRVWGQGRPEQAGWRSWGGRSWAGDAGAGQNGGEDGAPVWAEEGG